MNHTDTTREAFAGQKREPELDRLSNIIETFHDPQVDCIAAS